MLSTFDGPRALARALVLPTAWFYPLANESRELKSARGLTCPVTAAVHCWECSWQGDDARCGPSRPP